MSVLWMPHPGPQTEFLSSTEFEALYGGAKGGGKTDCLLVVPLWQIHIPGFKALVLRQTVQGYREALSRAKTLYGKLGATWSESEQVFTFPSGATVEFGHCADLVAAERYQGRQFHVICYDEMGQLAEMKVWTTLLAECRTTDPRIMCLARASANPGGAGHPHLKKRFVDACGGDGSLIYIWEDAETGEKFGRAFVPAKVKDNLSLPASYAARLRASLTEQQKAQLLEGDWNAGTGLALAELSWDVHWINSFEPPKHWTREAAFDWGFSHPFAYASAVIDEEGTVYIEESVSGRHLRDAEIVDSIRWTMGDRIAKRIFAGHDCWHEHRARGENTPTTAEVFADQGMPLMRASIDRKSGLKNFRNYLAWRGMGEGGTDGRPRLFIMNTPGNRTLFECLESMVVNPLDMEDVLKVDADPDDGEGGDDFYDCVRYLLAGRPMRARALEEDDTPKSRHYDGKYERVLKNVNKQRKTRRSF